MNSLEMASESPLEDLISWWGMPPDPPRWLCAMCTVTIKLSQTGLTTSILLPTPMQPIHVNVEPDVFEAMKAALTEMQQSIPTNLVVVKY